MITLKKVVSFILAFSIIFTLGITSSAHNTNSKILNIYSDGMLFLQNSVAVIKGIGTPGNTVSLILTDKNNKTVTQASTTILNDGTFSVSFNTPVGSFNEYTVIFKENGKEFETLENIVFGELWLASGQSNMQYPLSQSRTGQDMYKNNDKLSKWLRVLLVPAYPMYKNSTDLVPSEPQNDLVDALWVNGENPAIYNMSAVAYFFAEELMNTLGMPVGILNSSLGGSSIRSWLSRETIDNNSDFKNYLISRDEYISRSAWDEEKQSVYYDMTANYNQKIYPLRDFRISGMLWYQGETDLMTGNTEYAMAMDLLQKSYTELFNYNNGLLPFIFTQIASYNYSDDGVILTEWNYDYTKIQQKEAASRALVTIYDVPLTYIPEAGLIHPECKEEVGQRMALCATGLIYNKNSSYTASTVKKVEIKDNEIYITFNNTGDGLTIKGTDAKGFAICGDDGIYVNAKAEIVSPDTIKVYADCITSPKSVTYAFGVANQTSNFYATNNGTLSLPVAPFITDNNYSENFWYDKSWLDCDNELTWHTQDDEYSGYYSNWEAKNATITYSEKNSNNGTNGLNVSSASMSFYITPVTTYKDGVTNKTFTDIQKNYSSYGQLSFYIRNNGDSDIVFKGARFYENTALWYSPEVNETLDVDLTIKPDGNWHCITLDLNKLYHLGNECTLSYSSEKLNNIQNIRFYFSTALGTEANIIIDSFSFTPNTENTNISYEVDIRNADRLIKLFTAIILKIVEKFAVLFNSKTV